MYKPRNESAYFYPDRKWYSPLAAGSHEFLDKNGARELDDRVGFHFYATGITPFMVTPQTGKGYNVLLRLYGPLEPWFDKSWKPSDFTPLK